MISDTGLYLNWNPTWPRERLGAWDQAGVVANPGAAGGGAEPYVGLEPKNKKEVKERKRMMAKWERQYERGLNHDARFKCCGAFVLIS